MEETNRGRVQVEEMIEYKETKYGFKWGDCEVQRFFSDSKKCWVCIGIKTSNKPIYQIYVTKTGKVRIFKDNKEMT
jgi:hypothetical protein